jgi:hypothetical protein
MPDRQHIEQSGRNREAGKTDEHDGNHCVPDERHVSPQSRYNISAFHHGLTLPMSWIAGRV